MTTLVEIATTDNAFFKPLECPLPLTHASLLDAARKKFKNVNKQSRLFDGVSGEELRADGAEVELALGAKIVVSGKAGWKGAERLRAESAARLAAADENADAPVDVEPLNPGTRRAMLPLRLQLVSFSYDMGQPRDTASNINARGLPNPGKAAMGCTGLDKRLAKEVMAGPGAAELCERVVQEALRQIQLHASDYTAAAAAADADAGRLPLVRVGVGCDRGLHRSVALAEAATARLVRKAEHARSGRNSPGLEVLLRCVQLVDVDHRELVARRGGGAGSGAQEEEEEEARLVVEEEDEGGVPVRDRRAELRLVGGV